jgi:hypothetical protein
MVALINLKVKVYRLELNNLLIMIMPLDIKINELRLSDGYLFILSKINRILFLELYVC